MPCKTFILKIVTFLVDTSKNLLVVNLQTLYSGNPLSGFVIVTGQTMEYFGTIDIYSC